MLDGIKINQNRIFWHENDNILRSLTQPFNVHHNITSTSGLSILLHDVISLTDTTSCDNVIRVWE